MSYTRCDEWHSFLSKRQQANIHPKPLPYWFCALFPHPLLVRENKPGRGRHFTAQIGAIRANGLSVDASSLLLMRKSQRGQVQVGQLLPQRNLPQPSNTYSNSFIMIRAITTSIGESLSHLVKVCKNQGKATMEKGCSLCWPHASQSSSKT